MEEGVAEEEDLVEAAGDLVEEEAAGAGDLEAEEEEGEDLEAEEGDLNYDTMAENYY